MNEMELLSCCPIITVEYAAVGMEVHEKTAQRRFGKLRDAGRASFHVVGRGGHSRQCWFLTAQGVMDLFPDPYDVPWWLTESGLRTLWPRVERLHALYGVMLNLFTGVGGDWHAEEEPPRLLDVHWLRGPLRKGREASASGFFWAVLTYERGIRIFPTYGGKQLLESAMGDKWENRDLGLATYSLSEHEERQRGYRDKPDDHLDYTTWPSGILVMGDDDFSLEIARRNLPRDGYRGGSQPFLFVKTGASRGIAEGVVKPRPYDLAVSVPPYAHSRVLRLPLPSPADEALGAEIWRRPLVPSTIVDWLDCDIYKSDVPPKLGNPLSVGRPGGKDRPEEILGHALLAKIVEWVAEWSGLTVKNLARLTGTKGEVVKEECRKLVQEGWLQEHGGMFYLGERGIAYVARRDRVAMDKVRTRVDNDIREDNLEVGSNRNHTKAVNLTMIRLHEAGFPVCAGWRVLKDYPELGTQLKPDLAILAHSELGEGLHFIEVELTAKSPEGVKNKLEPHAKINGWDSADALAHTVTANGTTSLDYLDSARSPVIFIIKTANAERLFQRLGRGLPMLTTTLSKVRGGRLEGPETVWCLDGVPQALWNPPVIPGE